MKNTLQAKRHIVFPSTSYYHLKICCYCSGTKACLTLCDLIDCSTPGFSPSLFPGLSSNSCPLSQWCYLTISSSAIPFSFVFNLSQRLGLFQ